MIVTIDMKRLRHKMVDAGLTGRGVAHKAYISESTFYNLSKSGKCTTATAEAIAKALNIQVADITAGERL